MVNNVFETHEAATLRYVTEPFISNNRNKALSVTMVTDNALFLFLEILKTVATVKVPNLTEMIFIGRK